MMKRIVMHHSGGGHVPSEVDRQHYHRIVGGDGKVVSGIHAIEANAPGKPLVSGQYAAHVAGFNTGAIGLSMAAMLNAQWRDPRACPAFPTLQQCVVFIAEAARLCLLYQIPVSRETVLSHAEVQRTFGVIQAGKWDFDYDPLGRLDSRDAVEIGDWLRDRILAATKGFPA